MHFVYSMRIGKGVWSHKKKENPQSKKGRKQKRKENSQLKEGEKAKKKEKEERKSPIKDRKRKEEICRKVLGPNNIWTIQICHQVNKKRKETTT